MPPWRDALESAHVYPRWSVHGGLSSTRYLGQYLGVVEERAWLGGGGQKGNTHTVVWPSYSPKPCSQTSSSSIAIANGSTQEKLAIPLLISAHFCSSFFFFSLSSACNLLGRHGKRGWAGGRTLSAAPVPSPCKTDRVGDNNRPASTRRRASRGTGHCIMLPRRSRSIWPCRYKYEPPSSPTGTWQLYGEPLSRPSPSTGPSSHFRSSCRGLDRTGSVGFIGSLRPDHVCSVRCESLFASMLVMLERRRLEEEIRGKRQHGHRRRYAILPGGTGTSTGSKYGAGH